MAFNENRQDLSLPKYYAACASRRDGAEYVNDDNAIIEKYKDNLCVHGRYPDVLSSAMGNRYFMAKFNTLEEVEEFRLFTETRK